MTKAERIARALRRNGNAVHHGTVSWETFSKRNHALWREAEADPRVVEEVHAILREITMNTNGTKKKTTKKTPEKKAPAKAAKPKEAKPTEKERAPKEDLCVFAFRLLPGERDAIHKAAGPGKASKFIRSLAVAASKGDIATINTMVEAINK